MWPPSWKSGLKLMCQSPFSVFASLMEFQYLFQAVLLMTQNHPTVLSVLCTWVSPHVGAPVYTGWGNSSSGAPPEREEELTSAEWGFYEVLIGGVAATHKSCHRNADLSFPGEAGHWAGISWTSDVFRKLTEDISQTSAFIRETGKGCVFKTAARKSISRQ